MFDGLVLCMCCVPCSIHVLRCAVTRAVLCSVCCALCAVLC
eukprot:COSAG06_NODE_14918_length_1114_cov_1746.788177_2_plen_40_part_01